jgi:hypothetical protein
VPLKAARHRGISQWGSKQWTVIDEDQLATLAVATIPGQCCFWIPRPQAAPVA